MKRAITLLLALAVTASLGAQVFLTSFKSDDFIDYSDPSLSPTGEFSGNLLLATLSGDFLSGPIDITGYTSALSLTATVFIAPATGFKIGLVDSDFHYYFYEGVWNDFVTGVESTVFLSAAADQTGPFNFDQVLGLDFVFDSGSGETLDVTFDTLTALAAVPEPSAAAFLAGLAGLGFVVARRRRKV